MKCTCHQHTLSEPGENNCLVDHEGRIESIETDLWNDLEEISDALAASELTIYQPATKFGGFQIPAIHTGKPLMLAIHRKDACEVGWLLIEDISARLREAAEKKHNAELTF